MTRIDLDLATSDPRERLLVVRTRLQLLWMDFSVARAYYLRYVLPVLAEAYAGGPTPFQPVLRHLHIERENIHSRLVTYTVVLSPAASVDVPAPAGPYRARYTAHQTRLLRPDTEFPAYPSVAERMSTLAEALRRTRVARTTRHPTAAADDDNGDNATIPPTTCYDFWETETWWRERVSAYWFAAPYRSNGRRVAHMLNQLTRVLRQLYRRDVATAVQILRALSPRQIDLLNQVFVEPINGSLIASHLSTIFMHNKQQTGLNMKHEANKLLTLATQNLQSERDFDPKIHLKMCTSCVGREIFELMVLVRLRAHASPPELPDQRNAFIFCRCRSCADLRSYANAWRYYDCGENAWVRFEFPRKAYHSVSEILLRETARDAMQLVFSSDKNEFYDKRLFVTNFVNYYVFYENDQHPLVVGQCSGKMRNTVSVLYVFAIINWVMISDSRERKSNNSISLNQQSLCKSLNNTLYSIFSENCINRVQLEKTRRVIRENSAYINRGLGLVPNTGVNAFNCTHSVSFRAIDLHE